MLWDFVALSLSLLFLTAYGGKHADMGVDFLQQQLWDKMTGIGVILAFVLVP